MTHRKARIELETMVYLVIILVVLAVILFFFNRQANATDNNFTKMQLTTNLETCALAKIQDERAEVQNTYCGSDNFPVKCSICLGAKTFTNNDNDGMIDECEKDGSKDNPKKTDCIAYYSYDQCCTSIDPCPGKGITCAPERPAKKT
jgi:hypothetical protein